VSVAYHALASAPPNPKNNPRTYWLGGSVDLTASGRFGEEKNLLALWGFKLWTAHPVV